MRAGSRAVARALGQRLTPLLVLLALLVLAGDPRGAGVAGGLIAATAVAAHVVFAGLARGVDALAPAALRMASVWGVALAAGAGVFAATGALFNFIVIERAGVAVSIGGALLHLAAFLSLAGGGGLIFFCLAARRSTLDDAP